MQKVFLSFIAPSLLCFTMFPTATQAQSDAAKLYKTNCALCHSANGSGDNATGKAFHAKDLRSEEVQKQTDEQLAEVITKGKGKMPAFGAKITADDVTNLVSYLRALPKQK
jgi:mono/diheme cytochrome c family protein